MHIGGVLMYKEQMDPQNVEPLHLLVNERGRMLHMRLQ